MVATIDEKVQSAIADTVEMLTMPVIGSDEYLDKVSHYRDRFYNLAERISKLCDDLLTAASSDACDVQHLMPHLKSLHVSYLEAINMYKKGIYGRALKTILERSMIEARQIREFIDDCGVNADRIKANQELQDLFAQL